MQFNCDPELTQQLLNEYNYSYSNNRDPVRTPLLAGDEPAPPQRPDRAQSAPGALNRAAVSKPGILTAPQADANDDAPPEAAAPAAAPPAVVLPSYIYPEPFKEEKPRPQLQPPSKAEQQKAIAPITQELRGIFARRGSGAGASAGSSLLPPLTRLWR